MASLTASVTQPLTFSSFSSAEGFSCWRSGLSGSRPAAFTASSACSAVIGLSSAIVFSLVGMAYEPRLERSTRDADDGTARAELHGGELAVMDAPTDSGFGAAQQLGRLAYGQERPRCCRSSHDAHGPIEHRGRAYGHQCPYPRVSAHI